MFLQGGVQVVTGHVARGDVVWLNKALKMLTNQHSCSSRVQVKAIASGTLDSISSRNIRDGNEVSPVLSLELSSLCKPTALASWTVCR